MSNFNRLGFELSNGDVGVIGGEVINGTGEIEINWFQDDPETLRAPALHAPVKSDDARKLAALLTEAADDAERVRARERWAAMGDGYGERLAALLRDKVTSVKIIGQCGLPDGSTEESLSVMLPDGTELYVQVQGWPADAPLPAKGDGRD